MKLKKLLAAGLSVALGLSLSAPALAAEAADERLTRVALANPTRQLWAPVGA